MRGLQKIKKKALPFRERDEFLAKCLTSTMQDGKIISVSRSFLLGNREVCLWRKKPLEDAGFIRQNQAFSDESGSCAALGAVVHGEHNQ